METNTSIASLQGLETVTRSRQPIACVSSIASLQGLETSPMVRFRLLDRTSIASLQGLETIHKSSIIATSPIFNSLPPRIGNNLPHFFVPLGRRSSIASLQGLETSSTKVSCISHKPSIASLQGLETISQPLSRSGNRLLQ